MVAESNYTFDAAGRLTDIVHKQNVATLAEFNLEYDQSDRITKATSPDGVSDFTYDDTDQLVDAQHSDRDDESYVYDDNGNRINTGYVTGENNQLESDGKFNYEYDKEGNRVKRTEIANGEVTKYEWDYRNRLVGVQTKNSSGQVISNSAYTYDVFDNRIVKSVDADGAGSAVAKEEHFVYDGNEIALTFDGSGIQTERFFHGVGIDEVLAQENASGEVLWALTDNQGSVRMLLDNQGNVVNNITYDAFGNITLETNPDVNFRFSYTGRELDAETGLYNYRTRFLDPKTGQFINEDTIGFAGGDSNLYRYVANSPVKYTDPSGLLTVYQGNPLRDSISAILTTPGSSPIGNLGHFFRPQLQDKLQQISSLDAFDLNLKVNAGENYAEKAQQYYVDRINRHDENTPWYEKAADWAGGTLSSLWTCNNSDKTLAVLGTALGAGRSTGANGLDDAARGIDDIQYAIRRKNTLGNDNFIYNDADLGNEILDSSTAYNAYQRLNKQGTDLIIDHGTPPKPNVVGQYDPTKNAVTIFDQNNLNVKDATSTLVHESVHVDSRVKNRPYSQNEEYRAFRREFLYKENRRPTLNERKAIWQQVQIDYSDIPTGKNPFGVNK